ncbi:hypothetical protein F5Y15DRAFT_423657 [Xylariaceae sp. FL0016]|nr:hypothetical protein F5Y15DRAFT_423657 [Xylariaceae sp. FL0016]
MKTSPLVSTAGIILSTLSGCTLSYPTIQPCEASEPEFVISDYTGSTGSSGGQSFTFLLTAPFSDFTTGCSGSIPAGEVSSGYSWCSTIIPNYNVSYTITDSTLAMNHKFKCETNGAELEATAVGSGTLDLDDDRSSLVSGSQTIPVSTSTS